MLTLGIRRTCIILRHIQNWFEAVLAIAILQSHQQGGPKGPLEVKNWLNMAGLSMSQCGLKESKMIPNGQNDMLLIIWGHFWPIWTVWNHFRQSLIFCFESLWPKALSVFEAKNQVLSEMIRKSPNGPKMVPNDQKHVKLIL